MKINLKKAMITMLWMMVIFYQALYMLYYATHNSIVIAKMISMIDILLLCLILITIISFILRKRNKLPFLLGVVIYSLVFLPAISTKYNGYPITISSFVKFGLWPLLFIVFYYATLNFKRFPIKKYWIKLSYLILIILSLPLIKLHLTGQGQLGAVIFRVYGCLTILPIILHCTEYRKRYLYIFISTLIILCTTKRAGIVAALLGLVIFYLTDGVTQKNIRKKIYKIIKISLISVIFGSIVLFILQSFGIDIISRFKELSVDGGSGRNYIWSTVLNAFENSSMTQKMIGHGFNAVSQQVVIYGNVRIKAHNDLIEILFDYGYLGLMSLICFITYLFLEWRNLKNNNRKEYSIFSFSIIISIIFMLFSYYFIESSIINFIAIYWGVILAENRLEKRYKREQYYESKLN